MTIQRKNIITQKVSLQLKGQKYPVLPSNIYSWYKIFRKQLDLNTKFEQTFGSNNTGNLCSFYYNAP